MSKQTELADLADDLAGSGIPAADLAGLPAGSVLQVVGVTYNTRVTINASGTQDTGLSASITPSSTSSKIIVMGTIVIGNNQTGHGSAGLFRDSTRIELPITGATYQGGLGGSFQNNLDTAEGMSFHSLDAPSTTSSVTYKITNESNHNGPHYVNRPVNGGSYHCSSMILMEIAG